MQFSWIGAKWVVRNYICQEETSFIGRLYKLSHSVWRFSCSFSTYSLLTVEQKTVKSKRKMYALLKCTPNIIGIKNSKSVEHPPLWAVTCSMLELDLLHSHSVTLCCEWTDHWASSALKTWPHGINKKRIFLPISPLCVSHPFGRSVSLARRANVIFVYQQLLHQAQEYTMV